MPERPRWLDRLTRRGKPQERSASGQLVYRHTREIAPEWSGGDAELIEAIAEHVERHLGRCERVWHQLASPWVHIDIHVVEPTGARPWLTLVTSGMSERPMAAPEPDLQFAELVIALPPDWPVEHREEFASEANYWPLRLLQDLAILPHRYGTWLGVGHTVPNGDPPEPYAEGTALCGALLLLPVLTPAAFNKIVVGEREITFLGVYPLLAGEMQLKLDQGAQALVDRIDRADLTELLDPARPSVLNPPRG